MTTGQKIPAGLQIDINNKRPALPKNLNSAQNSIERLTAIQYAQDQAELLQAS